MSGITIDITVKQLVSGVISVATVIVGLLWLVMNSYMTSANHAKNWEPTVNELSTYKESATNLLNKITNDQTNNFSKLQLSIQESQEQQLNLRRDVLTYDISTLSKREKVELKKIEELMVKQGFLSPALITKF